MPSEWPSEPLPEYYPSGVKNFQVSGLIIVRDSTKTRLEISRVRLKGVRQSNLTEWLDREYPGWRLVDASYSPGN